MLSFLVLIHPSYCHFPSSLVSLPLFSLRHTCCHGNSQLHCHFSSIPLPGRLCSRVPTASPPRRRCYAVAGLRACHRRLRQSPPACDEGAAVTLAEGESIMQVLALRGSNVIEVMDGKGVKSLALFPARFQKSFWIKKGSFVVVDASGRDQALESGSKIACVVSQVLFHDQVRALEKSDECCRKNFPILSLLSSSDASEDEDDFFARPRSRPATVPAAAAAPPGCTSFDIASHPDLKLARRIGSGPPGPAGQEVLAGTLSRGGGAKRCKHQVVVKRVPVPAGEGLEGVQEEVERLRRGSAWCRNVCTFHGAVRVGGHVCFVMDRYVGSAQAEMRQNGGRLTLEQILRYGADIARGVAELHAADIVCMSIKPSNILLDTNGCAVVSDYGLSAILKNLTNRRVPDDSNMVGMDATLLSPNYTAPEAWGPLKKSLNLFWDIANGVSPESDAWSFGCTLVEMCTGVVDV